jgi:preprotein translocase subunit SecF
MTLFQVLWVEHSTPHLLRFLVILAIFIFGGDNLRGFMFAMLIGIGFGTYSSIFVASAITL